MVLHRNFQILIDYGLIVSQDMLIVNKKTTTTCIIIFYGLIFAKYSFFLIINTIKKSKHSAIKPKICFLTL